MQNKTNKTHWVIRVAGGPVAVAELLGITREAVHYWIRTDRIPAESGVMLYFHLRDRYSPLTLEDILHHLDHPTIQRAKRENAKLYAQDLARANLFKPVRGEA